MSRAFTLFTGQWADLPLEEVCRLARDWGYDGLELACWGDHFEVDRALHEDGYLAGRQVRAALLGHLQPPGRPGGLRSPDRRAAPGHLARQDLGGR
jgi:sugar phosphate isomerase/epimerase